MPLQPQLIAPFKTGLATDIAPWIAPADSFSTLSNCFVKHGRIEKRNGYVLFGTLSSGDRVMGIGRYISPNGDKETLAWDTTRAYLYNTATFVFDQLDAANIMDGSDTDFIWYINWQPTGGRNRFYFTNGKAFDGTLNGIRYYETASPAITTSFTPALNTSGSKTLYGGKMLFTIKQRLVVLYTYENDSSGPSNFPQRARWCKAQNPGNWEEDVAGGGGYVDAPTGDQIISARQVQNDIIVYFSDSVWALSPVSNPALPFRWTRINSFRACDGKMASIGYDRFSNSLGVRGISSSDTNQSQRIDDNIQNFVINEINTEYFKKVFCERDYQNKRWMTLFPSGVSDENDSALIRDDDTGAYFTYKIDLNCLGYGNNKKDWALSDFTVANNADFSIEDFDDETLDSYYYILNEEILLAGDISGNIFELTDAGADQGASITAEMYTAAWNPYNSEGREAQMSYIDFYVDAVEDTEATVDFYKDGSFSPYGSQTINFLPDLGFIASINNITQANPAVVTAPGHGLSSNDKVYIYNVKGMTKINGLQYTITVIDENSFSLNGIDSSAFTAYSNRGVVVERAFYRDKIWKRAYAGGIGNEHQIGITSSGANDGFTFHAFKPYFKPVGRRTIN